MERSLEAEGETVGLHTPFFGQHWKQARRVEPGWSRGRPPHPPHLQSRDTLNLCSSLSLDSEGIHRLLPSRGRSLGGAIPRAWQSPPAP